MIYSEGQMVLLEVVLKDGSAILDNPLSIHGLQKENDAGGLPGARGYLLFFNP